MSDKSERLFEAMSELSDEKIDEGAAYTPKKKSHWKRWTALAACLPAHFPTGAPENPNPRVSYALLAFI